MGYFNIQGKRLNRVKKDTIYIFKYEKGYEAFVHTLFHMK